MTSTSSAVAPLPSSIRFIERGWLNCNQILLTTARDAVLIDSGYGRHAGNTLAAVKAELGPRKLTRLINTHCHSDHMGGNAMIAREFRCRISVPEGEARHLEKWDQTALWLRYADQHAPRFTHTDTIKHGERFNAGGLIWQVLAAPGHDNDALMFWNDRRRILISGDALWQNGLGAILPRENDDSHLMAALETVRVIEDLAPDWVLPGHGPAFTDVAEAISRARGRLEALRESPERNARHVMKVMLTYSLLDRGSLRLDSMPSYLEKTPLHRELNERFTQLSFADLATRLVDELQRAGAVKVENGLLLPLLKA